MQSPTSFILYIWSEGRNGYFKDRTMSQKKTIAPGMTGFSFDEPGSAEDFYLRGNADNGRRSTFYSGMGQHSDQKAQPQAQAKASASSRQNQGKPVIGFLYSISRSLLGEYWPLHVGQNTIGSSPDCDIVLPEATVSQEHAVLVIRKMKSPEKVIASLSDARSTNGTIRNGQSLGFTAEECFNGDVLTFGDNYTCLLVLIDAASCGLNHSDSFIPLEEEQNNASDVNFGDDYDYVGDGDGQDDTVFNGVGSRPTGKGYTQTM